MPGLYESAYPPLHRRPADPAADALFAALVSAASLLERVAPDSAELAEVRAAIRTATGKE